MQAQKGRGRANALKGELVIRLQETSGAPAEVVYDLLADIPRHLEWAGTMQPKKNFRLVCIDGPAGPAAVGTEFTSAGVDPMGRFADSSVVTEATRPELFEFVTEARLSTKKGRLVEWTNVHRYEIEPRGEGCAVTYTVRLVRISELPGALGMFKVPGLRSIARKASGSAMRRGLRNLVHLADGRSQSAGGE